MEQNISLGLLKSIGRIYEQSKGCKLDPAFFETVDADLKLLSGYLGVSESQSFVVAMVFALNYNDNSVGWKELVEYLDCNPMTLLEYGKDFETLYTKGILRKRRSSHMAIILLTNDQFIIADKVSEAIRSNMPMPDMNRETYGDVFEVLGKIAELGQQRDNGEIASFELLYRVRELLSNNLHFPLIKRIQDCLLEFVDAYLLIHLIWKTISGKETCELGCTVEQIFDKASERLSYLQGIMSSENKLIREDYIELVEAQFLSDTAIKLTEASIKMVQEEGINLFANRRRKDNIMEPARIQAKTLFFNDQEHNQLDFLKSLLQEDNFRETQGRLHDRGLPRGITALLHGLPGTGKTETVFQVAKETDRVIVRVDISQTKSMWFGESERIVKRIFTDYKAFAKGCERMPILLFNEADAIIARRRVDGDSNVLQTENTMQNIILEELERFEGIFFATTNLAQNFDLAFDRRFLFKIEFQKPDIRVKAQIWKMKLPSLSDPECEALATRFDFTGGQIDNIVRKFEINVVVRGVSADLNQIINFCSSELLVRGRRGRVGFKPN